MRMRSIKNVCLQVGRSAGGFPVIGGSRWRRRRLLILCYHGISLEDEHVWDGSLYLSPALLADRLRLLKSLDAHVLPLTEAVERLYADDLPPRSVAITFDDGYHDFSERAFPLLADHGFPATVYLPTANCGREAPVFGPACSYILWRARGKSVSVPEIDKDALELRTAAGLKAAVKAVRAVARRDNLSLADKNALLRRLAAAVGVDYGRIADRRLLQIMNPSEVQRLSAEGVDFELHTHRHRTPLEYGAFKEEIETNRARLHEMIGRAAQHFCYPDGDYAPQFVPWLGELGVVSATTCDPGLATRATSPLMLPRFVDTSSASPSEFEGWICGAASFITPRRSYAHAVAAL